MKFDHCYQGDCRDVMRSLIAEGVRVQSIVTSPPYWGLRDYAHPGQLGQEQTLREFLANMVEVFDLCRELLADDGTLWLNMGDSYCSTDKWGGGKGRNTGKQTVADDGSVPSWAVRQRTPPQDGIKPKDLYGQPWRLAFALQDAGWWLRQDIIWHKPNPMPESVRDRCTKAHEYLFLLTKGPRYYFNADAIREQATGGLPGNRNPVKGVAADPEKHRTRTGLADYAERQRSRRNSFARETKYSDGTHGQKAQHRADREDVDYAGTRNKRSVWTIAPQSYKGAHFATFPEALVEPCISGGSRPGDTIFDPFMGSGTVAAVSKRLGRRWLGAELNPEYIDLQNARLKAVAPRQPSLWEIAA